ncbi:MAG TPA: hypothetical protein VM841_10920 [Actinomycetota bacterium]|nr:hypothetical protein [Actinomycetota bacterium]
MNPFNLMPSTRAGARSRRRFPVALWIVALLWIGAGFARSQEITLRMYPAPGTSTASPTTQITMRGAGIDAIGKISVLGTARSTGSTP